MLVTVTARVKATAPRLKLLRSRLYLSTLPPIRTSSVLIMSRQQTLGSFPVSLGAVPC